MKCKNYSFPIDAQETQPRDTESYQPRSKNGILLDNATKYIIENNHPNSPFTILKSEWQ